MSSFFNRMGLNKRARLPCLLFLTAAKPVFAIDAESFKNPPPAARPTT